MSPTSHDASCVQAERPPDGKVRCYYENRTPTSFLLRFLLGCHRLIVRILLKTGKTEFHPGELVMPDELASEFDTNQVGRATPRFEPTRRLTLARLDGIPVEEICSETVHGDSEGAGGADEITYRSLLAATGRVLQLWWQAIMFPQVQERGALSPSHLSKPYTTIASERESPPRKWFDWLGTLANRPIVASLVLAAFAIPLLLINLNYPLFEPDEARNAQLALTIVESGDWMSLKLGGEWYWDKPPLQHWSIAACYHLFGVSPMTTRLPGALATIFTIGLTFLLGRRLVGSQAAFLGASLLLLSLGFVLVGRYVTMDASLTCWFTLMILSLFIAIRAPHKKRWLALAGVGAGLGMLVKGPVILVLGLPSIVMALWLSGERVRWEWKSILCFVSPFLLIAAPWFIAMALVHPDFLVYFFWKHHVLRFSDAFNHREPFWYYLPAILIAMFPASYLIPSTLKFLFSRSAIDRNQRTQELGMLAVTAFWIVGFFSISEAKLPTYVLPAFPAICLMMGAMLVVKVFHPALSIPRQEDGLHPEGPPPRPTFLAKIPKNKSVEVLAFTAILLVVSKTLLPGCVISWTIVAGIMAVLASVVAGIRYAHLRPAWGWAGIASLGLFFVWIGITQVVPQIANLRSEHLAAKTLGQQGVYQDAPIIFYGREQYGIALTLPQERVFCFYPEDVVLLCQFLKEHPNSIIISSKDSMKLVRHSLDWTILLDKAETARHLYLSRPNPILIARDADAPLVK